MNDKPIRSESMNVNICPPKKESKKLICDVCKKNEAVGCCCVPMVPITMAYCRECLDANAHPWWIMVANTANINGLEHANIDWKHMVEDTCKHLGKTIEEFNKAVEKDIKTIAEYEQKQYEEMEKDKNRISKLMEFPRDGSKNN